MGELYYFSEVYEKVAHETPSFVCFYTMVDVLPDFSVEFVINVILQSNFLLRLSTNFRSVHLLHANKVIFTAGFVLWYCRWAPRRVLSLQHLLKRAFRLLGQWIRILDFYPINFTHDSKKHPGSTSACLLLVVFLARRFLIISLYLGQNAPKKM